MYKLVVKANMHPLRNHTKMGSLSYKLIVWIITQKNKKKTFTLLGWTQWD